MFLWTLARLGTFCLPCLLGTCLPCHLASSTVHDARNRVCQKVDLGGAPRQEEQPDLVAKLAQRFSRRCWQSLSFCHRQYCQHWVGHPSGCSSLFVPSLCPSVSAFSLASHPLHLRVRKAAEPSHPSSATLPFFLCLETPHLCCAHGSQPRRTPANLRMRWLVRSE